MGKAFLLVAACLAMRVIASNPLSPKLNLPLLPSDMEWIEPQITEGIRLFDEGLYFDARQHFREGINRYETFYPFLLWEAACQFRLRDYDPVGFVDRMVGWLQDVRAWHALKRNEKLKDIYEEQVQWALPIATAAADRARKDKEAIKRLALVLELNEDKGAATFQYDRLDFLDKKDPYSPYRKGKLSQSMGNTKNAIIFFENALVRDPDYAPAMGQLGILLMALNETEEAVVLLEKAFKLQPNASDEVPFVLGSAYVAAKQYATAVKYYRAGMNMRSDCLECRREIIKRLQPDHQCEFILQLSEELFALYDTEGDVPQWRERARRCVRRKMDKAKNEKLAEDGATAQDHSLENDLGASLADEQQVVLENR